METGRMSTTASVSFMPTRSLLMACCVAAGISERDCGAEQLVRRTNAKRIGARRVMRPNDPSSATRRTGRNDGHRDAPAGFAAAHGLARLTFTQRTVEASLPTKTETVSHGKSNPLVVGTVGHTIIARRQTAGLTQKQLARRAGIPRKWLGP